MDEVELGGLSWLAIRLASLAVSSPDAAARLN